jgi:MOB kinase activator 1
MHRAIGVIDGEFPRDLLMTVRSIFKQLFRILAHIYHAHYDKILHMSAESHLNTLMAHVFAFIKEFDLVEKKELAPLQELMEEFEQANKI